MASNRHWRPALPVALPIPLIAYISVQIMTIVPTSIPRLGWPIFWILVVIWGAALAVLLSKRINLRALRLAGARIPTQNEWWRLRQPWQQVLTRSGQRPDRYVLLVAEHESLVHRDVGPYAVVVGWESVCAVNDDELVGVLAQRLARHTSSVGLLVGLCAWAAVPLALVFGLGLLMYRVVRGIGKAVGAAVDEARPRTEAEAGCALVLLVGVFFLFLVSLIIGLTLLVEVGVTVVVALVTLSLARVADVASDDTVVWWGYGHHLLAGLARLDATGHHDIVGWRRLAATRATLRTHIRRVRQSMSGAAM